MNIPPKASIILPLEKPHTAKKMQRLRSSKVGWVQEVEHSVKNIPLFDLLCNVWKAVKLDVSQHWGQNRVWRIIFKLLTIQIYSFLWYSLQHLKVGEVVCQSTLRRGGGSQVSKSERPWLQILCKSTERASKQVSRQSLKQRRATEIISGSLLVLLILLHSFTETSWFHRKGKNFEFHHLPIKSLSACLKSSDHTQWSDETRHLKILFRKSQLSTKLRGCKILRKLCTH